MRCETCHGTGMRFQSFPETVLIDGMPVSLPVLVPCATCGGTGFDHCCDGDRACPDTSTGSAEER